MRYTDDRVDEGGKNCKIRLYHSLVFINIKSHVSDSVTRLFAFRD